MAKTKGTGSARLGRDSQPKYLGIKIGDGQSVKTGNVIIRQRGTKFLPGKNVKRGDDDTLYSLKDGFVRITTKKRLGFDNKKKIVKIVNVESR